jgi:hypothetical protein
LNEVREHVETKQDEKQRVVQNYQILSGMDLGRRKGKKEKNRRFKRAKVS